MIVPAKPAPSLHLNPIAAALAPATTITLREYQDDLANEIRAAFAAGFNAPLLVLPTGGGKTTIFSYVAKNAAAKGRIVWLIAHRAELVKQISLTLARFGVPHRICAPDKIVEQCEAAHDRAFGKSFVDQSSKIMVASVQTLAKRIHKITERPGLLIIDEAHHLTKESQWGIIAAACEGAKMLPVTATACRLDGTGLGKHAGGFADTIVLGPSTRWMMDEGFLSDYVLHSPPTKINVKGLRKTKKGDVNQSKAAERIDKPSITGNAVDHYLEVAAGKRAIIFTHSVEHAQHVVDEFNGRGVPAAVLDGKLDPEERDRIIRAFEAGEILALASCEVVSEGFDIPGIEVAILLRYTESLSLFLQQIGRALRPVYADGYDLSTKEGRLAAIAAGPKPKAIILDHVGVVGKWVKDVFVMKHGLPDYPHQWTLDGVVKGTREAANDNMAAAIKTCTKCFAIHAPAPACPCCGYVYPFGGRHMAVTEGKLAEMEASEKAKLLAAAEQHRRYQEIQRKREEQACETVAQMTELGRQRGYRFPEKWAERKIGFRTTYRRSA